MAKATRDVLEVLKDELQFLKRGGYVRPLRSTWRPQFIFEDSPTCMNCDGSDNPGPCEGCVLTQFVPKNKLFERIPCRHISLNSAGDTLASLYLYGSQSKIETALAEWLHGAINRLEKRRPARAMRTPGA